MTAASFNNAACVSELERFNDDYAGWNKDRFASLERGNSILCGTDNDTYQKFCRAYRDAQALEKVNPAAGAATERSRAIFEKARREGLILTTGPFAGPL